MPSLSNPNSLVRYGGTEQSSLITVSVNEVSLGTFDSYSGGEPTAKGNKHRAGGMGLEVSYGSLPSWSDITVSRVYEWARDWELERTLVGLAGRVTAHMTEQPLDPDGNAYGKPKVWQGRFLGVKPGKADSTSDAVRLWEIDIEVTSQA